VSPWGFAYNYRKRAQLLQRFGNQKHAQLSEAVIDSRPGGDLKKWGEAEWDLARRMEIQAFNRDIPAERLDMESVTQDVELRPLTPTEQQLAQLKHAIYSYDFAARLWEAADEEYVDHLRRHTLNLQTYESHRDEMMAERQLVLGDRDYLKGMLTTDAAEREALIKSARHHYERAEVRYALMILRYYVRDEDAMRASYPEGVTPQNFGSEYMSKIDQVTPQEALGRLGRAIEIAQAKNIEMPEEAAEYLTFIRRADARLKHLPS
jgi:hypothetical protein